MFEGVAALAWPARVFARFFKKPGGSQVSDVDDLRVLDKSKIPRHVAIIMDGNGRWATRRGLPRLAGHRVGADRAADIVKAASEIGVEVITLYVFSTENWKRPRDEVEGLMDLLVEMFETKMRDLEDFGARIVVVGARESLPSAVVNAMNRVEHATMKNPGILVNLALNYGGRDEIVRATRLIAEKVARGELVPDQVTSATVESHLYTAGVPHPDLLIRTGGEMRISNFLLWQAAYAEILVTPVFWPDFSRRDFARAIWEYQKRARRFGGI
ncbi:MAG: isoprenyl transferase [Bacillota bacterium]